MSVAPPLVAAAPVPRKRLNWGLFFAILFAPPLLTLLAARGGRATEGAAVACGLLGGGLAGAICGILLGIRLGSTIGTKVLLSVVFVGVLSVVCIGMSCFGCFAGGFKMDFR